MAAPLGKAPQKSARNGAAPATARLRVGGELDNEFTHNHIVLVGAFSLLFALGIGEAFKGRRLPTHVMRRLLRFYDPAFSTDRRFLFLCHSQKQQQMTGCGPGAHQPTDRETNIACSQSLRLLSHVFEMLQCWYQSLAYVTTVQQRNFQA